MDWSDWQCQRIVAVRTAAGPAWWWWLRRRVARWTVKGWNRAHEAYRCGQFQGHAGECTAYVPGDYLREPIIHPIDLWNISRLGRCPCGVRIGEWSSDGATQDLISTGGEVVQHDVYAPHRFGPCGHEFREILDLTDEWLDNNTHSVYLRFG
jgi:hypothetical protein